MKKIPKTEPVTLIELPATQFGILNGDISYDVYSKFRLPPRALPTLAGILKAEGWQDVQMISPIHQNKLGKLTSQDFDRINSSAFVGISAITRTLPQSYELCDMIRGGNSSAILALGGIGPSYNVEESLQHSDIVFMGESDRTVTEAMRRLERGEGLENVAGLAYLDRNRGQVINDRRVLLTVKELGELPPPHYSEAIIRNSNISVVEQERGCPYDCDFCLVTQTYGNSIRFVPIEKTIAELRRLREIGMTQTSFFTGDNAGGHPKHAIKMFETIKEEGLYKDGRTAQVSAAAARNPKLLKAMRNAGVKHLCVGYESINDLSLESINKPFNSEHNTLAAETFKDYGFWVHAMMMVGLEYDTPETARETLEWTKKHADSAQFFILTPLPGTRLYDKMDAEDRILTKDWSLYDAQHCVIQPRGFSPYELQKTVIGMYKDFYSNRSSVRRLSRSPNAKITLGILAYTSLKGIKRVINSPQTQKHLEWLESPKKV